MNEAAGRQMLMERFTVVGASDRSTRDGRPFLDVLLRQGRAEPFHAYDWLPSESARFLPPGLEVAVIGKRRVFNNRPIIDLVRIEAAPLSPLAERNELSSLPQWLLEQAENPAHVRELWAHVALLKTPLLRDLLFRILHDPHVGSGFVRMPASRAHHHCEPGGLLEHSLEVFRAIPHHPGMDRVEWELARVAGLLHDAGKAKVYARDRRSPGRWMSDHEAAGHELLSPHLDWLEQRDDTLAAALRYHLEWEPRKERPLLPGAMLVRCSDRISAALDTRRRAFSGEPAWKRFVQHTSGDRFFRCSPG